MGPLATLAPQKGLDKFCATAILRLMTKYSPQLDSIFHALADPTRRAVLARLARGPASVGVLAEPFDMALPSLMQHIKKLEDGGLIETRKEGRTRQCALRPDALAPVEDWLSAQRDMWNGRLDRLEAYIETLTKEKP